MKAHTQTNVLYSVNLKSILVQLGYALVLCVTVGAVIQPDVRNIVRDFFIRDYRQVVSTVSGDLLKDGRNIKIVKLKTRDALLLEFYSVSQDGESKFLQRIFLDDRKDAFFNYNGKPTNLALADIDGDSQFEILAPSFDDNMRAHLNVFHFDNNAQMFARLATTR